MTVSVGALREAGPLRGVTGRQEPLVAVVTPYYNAAPYLAECIESVLSQTHTNFEYLLADNGSTDGSREIAARYARQDRRIRLFNSDVFLEQLANYNRAIAEVGTVSKYLKIVCADDWIYPEYLRLAIEIAERDDRIGLVSSYYLQGQALAGSGVPYDQWRLGGRDACRRLLRDGVFFVGSPTQVLYRGSLLRSRQPFFRTDRYHADTDAAYEILLDHDLGFVHQVLSYMRMDNESISKSRAGFDSVPLDHLILAERYGAFVFRGRDLQSVRKHARRWYIGTLSRAMLRRERAEYWNYHRLGLSTIGWTLPTAALVPHVLLEVTRALLNPERTLSGVVARLRHGLGIRYRRLRASNRLANQSSTS